VFVAPTFRSGDREGDPAVYFRRELVVGPGLRRATLRATALGILVSSVNGHRVGDDVLAPGWTSYRHRVDLRAHDVTALLAEGPAVLGAIVGEGWALGRLGWANERNHYTDKPAWYAELELEYADRTETVTTDGAVRVGTGAVLSTSIYDGETHDARLEPHGWSEPGFDASGWSSVSAVEWPGELVTPLGPPIRRVEELAPVEVLTTPSGRTVVDFGQIVSGWVRFTVDGPAGTTVTLRHAELVTDGELDPTTLRTAKATDRYTLRGGGPETWEPSFTFHGFRYVEVDGWPGALDPAALRAVVVHSDMARTGWLETSDPLLNRLHANVVWSMRGNFVGVPTDCPQRDERLGWTGDIHAFAPTAAFLYDVRGVLGSWLTDLAAEQRTAGSVPWVVPDVLPHPSSPTALWSDVAVGLPAALYAEYGDPAILEAAYPSMTAFVDQVEGLLDERGLWSGGFQYGDWLDPDAPPEDPAGGKTDRHLVAAAYLCRTVRTLADAAQVLGHTADAVRYGALATRVREAFRAEYVTPTGRVSGETVTAYALAVCFGLVEGPELAKAGGRLAALVAKSGYRISTGFAGTPFVLDALTATGHLAEAFLMLAERSCPSFLYPVTQGATTVWERWDSLRPDGTLNPSGMTSLNHYALGAVASWLHRTVGGLSAAEPGYRRVRIAPRPGAGLTHATLRHDTDHGRIEVAWRLDGTTTVVEVTLPDGVTGSVELPADPDARTLEIGPGVHRWEYATLVEPGEVLDFDTPLRTLAADPAVWRSLTDVFAKHLPGIPIEATAPEAARISLNIMLDLIPGAPAAMRDDLAAALTGGTTR
jgi:alpha-L-rhamnosidase